MLDTPVRVERADVTFREGCRPRFRSRSVMSMHHIAFAVCLMASSVVILPPAAAGQASTAESTSAAAPDSQPDPTDSAATGAVLPTDTIGASGSASGGDSVPPVDSTPSSSLDTLDSSQAAQADTGAPGRDTTRAPGAADSTKTRAAAAPAAPVDSILSAACAASGGSTSVAPNLLVVLFTAESGAAQRAAAAGSIKGKLVGRATPEGYYIRVPGGGGEMKLRAYADRLSRLTQVRQVGSRACPPLSSSKAAPQQPS
jgi:hypothetical protein